MQNYNNADTDVFHWRKRKWDDWNSEVPIRTGFAPIKPWLRIAVHTSCFALLTEDSPKSSHGQFRLVLLICVFVALIVVIYYYLFILRCSRVKNVLSEKMLVSAFILMQLYQWTNSSVFHVHL